jgi:hypothetical protein
MGFDDWKKLLGKSPLDAELAAALSAAGIKKIPKPKYREGEFFVQLELRGKGLEIHFTEEAILEGREDDAGKGPLLLSGVLAKLGKAQGRDLYAGALPSGITRGMSRAEVVATLGEPTESDDGVDIWKKRGDELTADYAKNGELSGFSVMLPNATG